MSVTKHWCADSGHWEDGPKKCDPLMCMAFTSCIDPQGSTQGPNGIVKMGKADWLWDEELNTHIPYCAFKDEGRRMLCGNPLIGDQILNGKCEQHDV